MPVTDQQAAALRALLAGREQDGADAAARLTDDDMPSYETLLQTALSIAASRHFASGYTDGDIIRFIAGVRAGTAARAADLELDPRAAETVLRRALGEPAAVVADPWTRLRAVVALLTIFVSGMSLDDDGLDALISDARGLADQRLATLNRTE